MSSAASWKATLAATPLAAIEQLVLRASREIQPLAALTPLDVASERARLAAELQAGRSALPRWSYAPRDHLELRRALDAAERVLAGPPNGTIRALYLARVRELSIEAALCEAAGSRAVAELAAARFAPIDPSVCDAATQLCTKWLGEPVRASATPLVRSDDSADPRSLLSRMREAVGRRKLPFAVQTARALAPLAATGDATIFVAVGRHLDEEDTARTVLHEIDGHACPRARARRASLALFRAGTARGVDDQEGRALLFEERAGLLGPRRRRQLAVRHRAVQRMLAGASYADVAWMLVREHGVEPLDAVIVAERAFRGCDGTRPGLGRERVYIEGLVRVRAHLTAHPEDERVLGCGQVAVDASHVLRPFVEREADWNERSARRGPRDDAA
ncbi:MAG: tyrosine/phenylalanine carboxypeptidase domain-containing protein [Polyangiaceae bacterium]|jgi:hypothetical protein